MKKIRISLIPLLLTASCLFLSGCYFPGVSLNAKFIEEKDWALSAQGVEIVDAETTNGEIELTCKAGDEIKIHAVKTIKAETEEKAEEFAAQVVLHAEQVGDTVKVYYEHPKGWKRVQVGVSYTIVCPAQLDVKLRSTNGKIRMDGVEKTVDEKTTNGSIHLKGGQGTISLRSTNGNLEISDSVGRVDASTTNGGITAGIASMREEIRLTTTNGNVRARIGKGSAPVHITSTNGSVTAALPSDYSGQLDARTSNGRITSDFAVPVKKASKNQLIGPIGEGGDNTLYLKTTNGSVRIEKQDAP